MPVYKVIDKDHLDILVIVAADNSNQAVRRVVQDRYATVALTPQEVLKAMQAGAMVLGEGEKEDIP